MRALLLRENFSNDFTSPVEAFHIRIFVRSSMTDIQDTDDLSGRIVAVVETNKGLFLMKEREGVELQVHASLEEAVMALLSGNADALVYPEPPFNQIVRHSGIENRVKAVGKPLHEVKRGIAVHKGLPDLHKKLDDAVKTLITLPVYKNIYTKWYGKPKPFWNVTRIVILMGILLALIIICLMLWHYRSVLLLNKELINSMSERKQAEEALHRAHNELEKRVEERTGQLRSANEQLQLEIDERKQAEETLRESEKKYRDLFENVSDGICFLDAEGNYTDINKAVESLTGYPKEELLNMNAKDFVHPEDQEKSATYFNKLFGDGYYQRHEGRMINKKGEIRHIEVCSNAIIEDNEVIGFRDIIRDITERKHLEAQLLETQKMEAIATLAGGIAHEFNNTLVGITGNIDLLQMDLPDEENISKYAEPMKASALHMAHLTDQLLAYARGGKYQPKNILLSDFVEETLPLIKQTIDPSIRLETDLPHDIFNVEADLTQMQMVLSAVLNNASEAIEDKGRIRITTREEEIDEEFVKTSPGLKLGPYVCLTVEDDGKGMHEEIRSRIFDPFFTTKFQGRGLGMAAVHGIVTNHDGWTSVDSELGKGTVVRIYLPAIASARPPSALTQANAGRAQARRAGLPAVKVQVKEEEKPKIEPAKGTGTILVIEDEDVVIDVILAMLKRLGYRILLAKTGKKAVNIAKTFDGDIDLAILDIVLPDLAGKEVYRHIMEARPNLKVIVCSGYAIDGPPQEILDEGAQDFIQKPFFYATLSEKLKEVLEGKLH